MFLIFYKFSKCSNFVPCRPKYTVRPMRAAVATTAMKDPIKIFAANDNDEALLAAVVLKRKD